MSIRLAAASLALFVLGAVSCNTAYALPPFKAEFDNKYVKESSSEELKAAFKKESCNTCHVKGKKKNVQNRYGHEIHEVLEDMLKDAKIAEKPKELLKSDKAKLLQMLDKTFDAVAKMKAKSGETYGDIIKSGSLPGTGDE